jgi:hypothetical protein
VNYFSKAVHSFSALGILTSHVSRVIKNSFLKCISVHLKIVRNCAVLIYLNCHYGNSCCIKNREKVKTLRSDPLFPNQLMVLSENFVQGISQTAK